jgi:ribosome biogenesis GTPase A
MPEMLDAFRERKLEVIEALGNLGEVARSIGAASLAARVDLDLVKKLESDRFHLVVVGEFNHGKSTFVNALLGNAALPIGVTPTTAVIHHIVWSDEPCAKVVLASGQEQPLPFEDVKSFATGGARSEEPVSYVEVGFPAELLRERIVLVDTPGVNDLSLTRAEITYGYIPRSDAVLFVLDAGQPVKESERQFLEHQLIGKSRDKIFFVVAKSDIWSDDERTEALAYVRNRLAALVKEPQVFAVSAQTALAERPEQSGLPELVQHLTRFLAEERGRVLLSNALGEGVSAAAVLSRGVDARRRAVAMSSEQIARRIEMLEADLAGQADTVEKRRLAIREEAGAIKAWARRDLDRFCDDVVRQLPAILEQASGDDLKQHLGPFFEHSFRQWAELETREIAAALEALGERMVALVKDDAHDVGKRVSGAMGADLKAPPIEVDRFAYDVGIFAVLSIGMGVLFANVLLGGLLMAAAPALALWNRGRTEAEIKKRALELGPVVLRDAAAKVGPKIDEMVDEFASRLDEWVVTAGQELHREVIEVLASVRDERESGAADRDAELARVQHDGERLAQLSARLEALKSTIAGAPA